MFLDPTFILLIPAIILAFWAQAQVNSNFSKYSRVSSTFGMTGAGLARFLLDNAGLRDVEIEAVRGKLTDHYDPRRRKVRLSESTMNSKSIAALGVVAHEVGHAIQHSRQYTPLVLRNMFAPVASFGSSLSWIIFIVGLLFFSPLMIRLGILLFLSVVLFALITLPVEFNASKRAKSQLAAMGMPAGELAAVDKVLRAASMTYIASTAMAIFQLLRMVLLAGVFGRRD
ncbi:MAG TPA: peptidase [Kosmotogaceae bacterium]|nr:peptidase [Kosmotogaceae bacterium]